MPSVSRASSISFTNLQRNQGANAVEKSSRRSLFSSLARSCAVLARRLWIPPRIQAFEFGDQPWLKRCWREAYLDGLNFSFRLFRIHHRMHKPFSNWAKAAGHQSVMDLASGGAGPIEILLQTARQEHTPLPRILLSDLFPDLKAFERLKKAWPEQIEYVSESVDAADPTTHRHIRLLSICNGFHHFPPSLAKEVLAHAGNMTDGIFIMEVYERNLFTPFLSWINLPLLIISPFFSRRISLLKIAITTLLPIIPLMIAFDGSVSALRTYRPEELLAMLPDEAKQAWHWESDSYSYCGPVRATYHCAYRK